MAKKGTISRWVCIRECYDNTRVWTPGEIINAKEPPMPRHFRRLYQNESPDPIDVLRGIFDDKGLEYDPEWDHNELVQRLNDFEKEERRLDDMKKSIKAKEMKKRLEERMRKEAETEVAKELEREEKELKNKKG